MKQFHQISAFKILNFHVNIHFNVNEGISQNRDIGRV